MLSLLSFEGRLRRSIEALGLAAELQYVLQSSELRPGSAIGELRSYLATRMLAELLIECEEDCASGRSPSGRL
jgi:hypothetical protein